MYNFYSYAYAPRDPGFVRSVLYECRLAETDRYVKVILDKKITSVDADGFLEVSLISDNIEAVSFDKQTNEIDNEEVFVALANMERYLCTEENFTSLDRILSLNFDVYEETALVPNGTTINVNETLSEFVRRIVFLMNKRLFKVAPELMKHEAYYLAKYIHDIDNIEKLCLTISEETVRKQVRESTLTFFEGGKKLKSIIGLPVDIASRIDEYGSGDVIHHFQKYVKNGIGNVDELRKMLEWLDAMKKLGRKRKLDWYADIDSGTITLIGEILQYGCTVTAIMNAVSREMFMYTTGSCFYINSTLRNIRDTFNMQREIGIDDTYINQNIEKWHFITARNCKIIKESRSEEYSVAAGIINRNSRIVDGWLIKCPDTERELFDIGNRYNNCLPIYRDKIIDSGAIIYSMYPVDDENNVTEKMPPVTFEVNSVLDFIQIKTFNDVDVTDNSIIDVIKKWRTQIRRQERGEASVN